MDRAQTVYAGNGTLCSQSEYPKVGRAKDKENTAELFRFGWQCNVNSPTFHISY